MAYGKGKAKRIRASKRTLILGKKGHENFENIVHEHYLRALENLEGNKIFEEPSSSQPSYENLQGYKGRVPQFVAFLEKYGHVHIDDELYALDESRTARNVCFNGRYIGYLEYHGTYGVAYHGKVPRAQVPNRRGVHFINPRKKPIVLIYVEKSATNPSQTTTRLDGWSTIPFP